MDLGGGTGGSNMLLNLVIRPPRNTYPDDTALNNSAVVYGSKTYVKKVLKLPNAKGEVLCCTFIEPKEDERPSA